MRRTAASPPGATTVSVPTMWSYVEKTGARLAMSGWASRRRNASSRSAGGGTSRASEPWRSSSQRGPARLERHGRDVGEQLDRQVGDPHAARPDLEAAGVGDLAR